MASSTPEKENGKIEGEEISEKAMTKLDKTILIKKRTLLSLRVLYLEKPKISSI